MKTTINTMGNGFLLLCAVLISAITNCASPTSDVHQSQDDPVEAFKPRTEENSLRTIAQHSEIPVLLEFSGPCQAGFPVIEPSLSLPVVDKSLPATALKAIFPPQSGYRLINSPKGLVIVSSEHSDQALLTTRISSLHLDDDQRYDPSLIILAAINSPEIRVAEMKQHTRLSQRQLGLSQLPSKAFPSLPKVVSDATLQDVLERVLTNFGGLVVFGQCRADDGTSRFDVRYLSKK